MGNDELIRKQAMLHAIEKCHKKCCRTDSNGDEWIHYETALNELEALPPVQMEDAISRQSAIYVASGYCHPANIAKELAKLPSVQPKRGKWIPEYENHCYNGHYKIPSYCSCCKDYYTQSPEEMKFCPNCGAYMVGEDDGTD